MEVYGLCSGAGGRVRSRLWPEFRAWGERVGSAREIGNTSSRLFGRRVGFHKRGEVERHDDNAVSEAVPGAARGMVEIVVAHKSMRVGIDIGEEHLRRVIRGVRSACSLPV